jgi:hypothetical protein
VIALLYGCQGWLGVHLVLGADEGGIGQLWFAEKELPGSVNTVRVEPMLLGEGLAPEGIGFGHSDKADVVRVSQSILSVDILAPVPGADLDGGDWFSFAHGIR